jgi:G3E family GTPase
MSMARERDPLAGKLPVTLITGFLGSGKTTLISRLLKHPDMNRVAVVINEIGEIGIDHDLVTMSSENVSLLANGCLCCTVRTDLQDTLRQLFGQRRSGEIADFDRVVIETTGLADPAPVVQTLAADTMLGAQYRLDGVVTLVDAVNGAEQLANHSEAEKQAAIADLIIITKEDLATSDTVASLERSLHAINGNAVFRHARMGEIEPSELIGLGLASARSGPDALRFLGTLFDAKSGDAKSEGAKSGGAKSGDAKSGDSESGVAGGGDAATAGAYLGERLQPRHDSSIHTLALRFEKPFNWDTFAAAMDMMIGLRGVDLLRVKGIVNVEGLPVVVQAVQHIMHPPVTLDQWPSADRQTRLVFITRDIPEQAIRGMFDAVNAMRK